MTASLGITIEIRSYWRAGTGRGASGRLNALCARDRIGLPYLPGRTLKGLLRDAVERAERWGWFSEWGYPTVDPATPAPLTELLFGQFGFQLGDDGAPNLGEPIRATRGGCLGITSARLSVADRAFLKSRDDLKGHLFSTLNSTAIDGRNGTALERSLRTEEVAVPLTLEAEATAISAAAPEAWHEFVETVFPLIRAVGNGRSRGLGRCRIKAVRGTK